MDRVLSASGISCRRYGTYQRYGKSAADLVSRACQVYDNERTCGSATLVLTEYLN